MPESELQPRFLTALEVLTRHRVEFIVVGAIAAGLEGAIAATEDLDFVYRKTDENCERLAAALEGLDARYVDPLNRDIRPTFERLRDLRISLLKTNLGRLDALSEIGPKWSYEVLLPRSVEVRLGDISLWSLGLEAVIEAKEFANRPKDREVLPLYRAVLERRKQG
jgi:hypothetical protein